MNMPVNIGEVLKIATDMKEVVNTPLSVSIYIDESAPGILAAHVRSAFASTAESTRVTIGYLDDGISHKATDDFAVIVAGSDMAVGADAKALRDGGTPVMVVTNCPHEVDACAQESGCPIPPADIVAPVKLESKALNDVISKIPFIKREVDKRNEDEVVAVSNDAEVGEIELNDEALSLLDARMGKWLIEACKDKDLALAYSFPFVRRPLAQDSINATSLQNGAIGLVPIIPGADMPIMTLNQIKMTLQIATAYGQPLDKERIKEIVAVVGGAFVCRQIVRSASKVVPFAGWLISGGIGFAATEAMGRALLEYFEAGGDIVGVASVLQTARDATKDASKKAAASPLGQNAISKVKDIAGSALGSISK